jgi:heme-degrading monooxygenase HmoA
MRVVVFRNRLRAGVAARFDEHAGKVYELAREMPGFVSSKDFVAEDGERLTVIEFDSAESLEAWRVQPDHYAAQRQGRDDYFDEYSLQVCELIRESKFKRAP